MKPLRRLSDRTADRLVRGYAVPEEPALTDLVTQLSALVPDAPPTPSDRLARLLEQGPPATTGVLMALRSPVRRHGLALRRLTLGATAALGLVLAAASADTLPDPAQQVVADVVGLVTPIELPKPDDPKPAPSPEPTGAPYGAPTATPGTPLPRESVEPSPAATGAEELTPDPAEPTEEPTEEPTDEPTEDPTEEPTEEPTDEPTAEEPEADPDGDHDPAAWVIKRPGSA